MLRTGYAREFPRRSLASLVLIVSIALLQGCYPKGGWGSLGIGSLTGTPPEKIDTAGTLVGCWSGKWDDTWKVYYRFTLIDPSDVSMGFRIVYSHENVPNGPIQNEFLSGAGALYQIQGNLFVVHKQENAPDTARAEFIRRRKSALTANLSRISLEQWIEDTDVKSVKKYDVESNWLK